ncbi:MAG: dimethylamine monooxygenase subunit DmmA family protein [Acetobacter papayae]
MIVSSQLPFAPLVLDASGVRHLYVRDEAACPLPEGCGAATPEVWTVVSDATAMADTGEGEVLLRSDTALLERLAGRLARERVGLRLYAAGGASFLARVAIVADAAGLGTGEVQFAPPRDAARRVVCVHCDTLNEGVAADTVRCLGCGTTLFVREHYSRGLGAYMGVGEPEILLQAMEAAARHG